MPNPIYSGAQQVAGAFRGYRIGRIPNLTTALRHYTVGVNSLGTCGRDFQMLQARNGILYQGAEVDCVNYGAGMPWNWNAVHVEAEWHPIYNANEPILNEAMIQSLAAFAEWLEYEWGIRRSESYHGYAGRITSWRGWTDHCWLIQSGDYHYNYWPIEEWNLVASGGVPKEKEVQPGLFQPVVNQPGHPDNGKVFVYDYNTHTKTWIKSMPALNEIQYTWGQAGVDATIRVGVAVNMVLDARDIDTFSLVTPPSGGGGSMPTDYARREDIVTSTSAVLSAVNAPRTLQ
jgi:hypothetical protein